MLLRPARRNDIVGAWFRLLANSTIALARIIADVRLEVRGSVPPGSCVAVMNHQSLLDIPIAYSLVSRPYPVIPTRRALRAWHSRHLAPVAPGASARSSARPARRRAPDVKASPPPPKRWPPGRLSMLIYPEGHRTDDGTISPFMTAGLRAILGRTRRPVYLIVIDGLWHARTTAEALFTFAGTRGKVRVVGPIPPPETDDVDVFIAEMEARMVATLAELRA